MNQLFALKPSSAQVNLEQMMAQFSGYLVYVRPNECKDYLDFPGSPLKPIVKVTMSYCHVEQGPTR